MILAVIGISVELVAIILVASRRVPVPIGMPLLMIGLLMAILPILARVGRSEK